MSPLTATVLIYGQNDQLTMALTELCINTMRAMVDSNRTCQISHGTAAFIKMIIVRRHLRKSPSLARLSENILSPWENFVMG